MQDKPPVPGLSDSLDSRFGSEVMGHVAESKVFPKGQMREDVAYQIITDELYLDGNAR